MPVIINISLFSTPAAN